jgi:hypothetical protein
MLNRVWTVTLIVLGITLAACARASAQDRDVSVEVVGNSGASFEQFRVRQLPAGNSSTGYRAYLKAERGAPYRIRISNRTPWRVGVVIAVDGRNIISGGRSDLARTEEMYIFGPWQTSEISGWRTSLTDVHEFFFTDFKDSYAQAFGDGSAKGVIAVAVYRERQMAMRMPEGEPDARVSSGAAQATSPAPAAAGELSSRSNEKAQRSRKDEAAGTGFGDQRYEPTMRVAFEAEKRPSGRVILKYEWEETLCHKGIIDCGEEKNRFWSDDLAFAPFPPGQQR